jgi:hypothetical protein
VALTLTIQVTGEQQIRLMLEGVAVRCRDLRPVWGHIATDFDAMEARQFATEGGLGERWASLSPAYAAWKSRNYPGKKIMELTGALRSSLAERGPGHIDRRAPDTLELGTSVTNKRGVNYGLVHQTKGVGGKIRKTIVVPETAQQRWLQMIGVYLTGGNVFQMMQRVSLFGG